MSKHKRIAAEELQRLLDGEGPNGADTEDFGSFAQEVEAVRDAYDDDGVSGARRAFAGLADENPALGELIAGAEEDEAPNATDPLELGAAPSLPSNVYDALPALLDEAASYFEQRHERDVFLASALGVLSGCLPNLGGYYGHNAEWVGANLYMAIVAGAAGGKGPVKWGRRLSDVVDETLRKESDEAQTDWKKERDRVEAAGETFEEPRPPNWSLVLPGNTSAAAFHEGLADRGGRAVLVETEIDTMTNAMSQDWGQFDDTLRKAAHHEPVSYLRKGDEQFIDETYLSVVLSGTEWQFERLIGSAENGLYSRFALYYFEAPAFWIDQRPTRRAREKVQRFEELAGDVWDIYEALSERETPLCFRWTDAQWDRHGETFAPILRRAYTAGAGHLGSVVKRAGLIAFRLSMTLSALRGFEQGAKLERARRIEPTDEDVETALKLACTYADHALRFGKAHLSDESASDAQAVRIGAVLDRVEDTFTNSEVYVEAKRAGVDVSEGMLRKDLRAASRRGLIEKTKRSKWRKT
jgi:hypothetical protein